MKEINRKYPDFVIIHSLSPYREQSGAAAGTIAAFTLDYGDLHALVMECIHAMAGHIGRSKL